MAESRSLAMLVAGQAAWNTWRLEHASEHLDLSGVDLTDPGLPYAKSNPDDPFDGYIIGMFLDNTNLSGAIFEDLCIRDSSFVDSNLGGAVLKGARFSRSSVRRADLRWSDLRLAEFIETDITEAQFDGALLEGATVDGEDLAAVLRRSRTGASE